MAIKLGAHKTSQHLASKVREKISAVIDDIESKWQQL